MAKEYYLSVRSLKMCRIKLRQRNDVLVQHVRRQTNRVAHLMARIHSLLGSFNLFMSPPPYLLENLRGCIKSGF